MTILDEKNPVAFSLLAELAGFTSGAKGGPIGSGGPLSAVQTAIISEATDRDTMPKILGIAAILEMASAMAGAFSVTILSLFKMNVYYLFYAALVVGLISIAVPLRTRELEAPNFSPRSPIKPYSS